MKPYLEKLRTISVKLNTFETDASYIHTCKYDKETAAFGAGLQQIKRFINNIK